jgi:hypothetical protein
MNIFQKIKLIGKINKAVKTAKKKIDSKESVAKDLRKVIKQLKLDIETLMTILPECKDVCLDLIETFKNVR